MRSHSSLLIVVVSLILNMAIDAVQTRWVSEIEFGNALIRVIEAVIPLLEAAIFSYFVEILNVIGFGLFDCFEEVFVANTIGDTVLFDVKLMSCPVYDDW